jgi:hypothetical protein
MFGGGGAMPDTPRRPIPPPVPVDPPVTAWADELRRTLASARGRAATIATSGAGLLTQAPTEQRTLKELLGQ